MNSKPQFKFIKSRTIFMLAILMGILWGATVFSHYGSILAKQVPNNFLPMIHAFMFASMLGGFFASLFLWMEESIVSGTGYKKNDKLLDCDVENLIH